MRYGPVGRPPELFKGDTAVVFATENPGHLSRFVLAELWSNVVP
jgi:hypothetical protein